MSRGIGKSASMTMSMTMTMSMSIPKPKPMSMGIGKSVMALTSLAQKRDVSVLWDLDPVAAPPKKVQRQLLGTDVSEQDGEHTQARHGHDDELRSILELQLTFAMRQHDVDRVRAIARQLRDLDEHLRMCARARGELCVGDHCFALAKVVEWEWYHARLTNVRARSPTLQVEYLATLEGDESKLALPVPRVNYVPLEHVRILKPEPSEGPVVPPLTSCVVVGTS